MAHIYIRPSKKVTIIKNKIITIQDLAQIEGPKDLVDAIKPLVILKINAIKNNNYLVTVMDFISTIRKEYPDLIIYNLGEKDTMVCYKTKMAKENKYFTVVKIILVGMILICGGTIAIMTFHTDTQLPGVFTKFYFLVMGDNKLQPYIIEIPYAIGLTIGIIVFFNHFSKIKISDDPTPIEVEVKIYENQVDDSIIDTLKEKREGLNK